MQTLTQTQPQGLRQPILLNVTASFMTDAQRPLSNGHWVPPLCVTVRFNDDQPVTGLASENFSIVNAEAPSDLTHLCSVTEFICLPEAGRYQISVDGATWSSDETKKHCCIVHVTRVARLRHAIELGRTMCSI